MRNARPKLAALLALQLVFAAGTASAQDAPGATALRDRARAELAAGRVADACLLFEQSYEAARRESDAGDAGAPAPDEILYELAGCHEKQGKREVAAAEYEQVAAGTSAQAAAAKERAAALRTPAPPEVGGDPGDVPQSIAEGEVATGSPAKTAPASPAEPGGKEGAPARVGDFIDTRLTWVFGDDDFLHQTGEALPLSPDASVGDRRQYRLFFDNLNSRFAGRENLTHLALYGKAPGFIRNLDTEASMVLRFDLGSLSRGTGNLNSAIYDAGSFLRIFYHTDQKKDGDVGLGLTLWPLDTDRFRLGYLYDISWGGTAVRINQSIFPRLQGSAPGGKLQYDGEGFSVYAGFKTASIVQVEQVLTPGTSEVEQIRIGQTNYGALAGAGFDAGRNLHFDVGGGFFQQGKFDLPDVQGEPIYTFGGSARAIVHHEDMPVPQSIDFQLYRNDPNRPMILFRQEKYTPGKTTWAVSLEGSNLMQRLKEFEVAGGLALQPARAAALQANLKSGFMRLSLTGIYRDLPFVLRNQPSFIPFQTLPVAAGTSDELFFAGAVDYHIEGPRLTPGLGAGLQFPATFKTATSSDASAPINRTVVVREQGNIAILPVNAEAVPIFQARASLKWDLSNIMSALVWVQYVRDNNGTFVERDPSEGTVALRTFVSPNFLGAGTSVQARF